MTLDLHKGNSVDTERHCLPTSTRHALHDDQQEQTFGRWLGQINGQR